MEFQYNAELEHMSVDDLNQRYESTFALYDGQVIYIQNFGMDQRGRCLYYVPYTGSQFGEGKHAKFQARLLNTARPAAGWHLIHLEVGCVPVLFTLSMDRQWKRGLCASNSSIYLPPYAELANLVRKCHNLEAECFNQILQSLAWDAPRRHLSKADIEGGGVIVPRRDRLFYFNNGAWDVYLRRKLIARIPSCLDEIFLAEEDFMQEIAEVTPGLMLANLPRKELPFHMHPPMNEVKVKIEDEPDYFDEEPPPPDRDRPYIWTVDFCDNDDVALARDCVMLVEHLYHKAIRLIAAEEAALVRTGDIKWAGRGHIAYIHMLPERMMREEHFYIKRQWKFDDLDRNTWLARLGYVNFNNEPNPEDDNVVVIEMVPIQIHEGDDE